MIRRVIVQPPASRDIDDICTFLAGRCSATAVEAWYNGCMQAIRSLATNAERCSRARESARLGVDLRQLLYRRHQSVHRLLFVIRDDAVRVVHIRHSARAEMTLEDLPAEDRP